MATITKGKTFGATESVTATKLHNLVDNATISGIVNADIDAGAAIDSTKIDLSSSGYMATGEDATITGTFTFSTAPVFSAAPDLAADSIDAITEIKSTLKSGSDSTLITGTKGTTNYTAKWNGDGDLVDGYEVLDEDDMGSDSATKLATQQSIKAYVDSAVVSMKTGTYTGDGTTSQSITGIGFQPKYVRIWNRLTVDGEGTTDMPTETTDTIMDDNVDGGAIEYAGDKMKFQTNKIISLDADGFTVHDAGEDDHPNKNGQVYNYLAFG